MKVVLPERLRPHLASLPSDVESAWYTNTEPCLAALAGAEVLWLDFALDSIEGPIEAGTSLRWVTTLATGVNGWPLDLIAKNPGSLLGPKTLVSRPFANPDGTQGVDQYIKTSDFRNVFAQDLRAPDSIDSLCFRDSMRIACLTGERTC